MIVRPAKRLDSVKEYYFSKKLKELRGMISAGKPVINLGIGSPDLPPSDNVLNTMSEITKDKNNHGYQSYVGLPEFRKEISNWYRKIYDVSLDGDTEILPLLGSKEGIMHISMAFVDPGDKVLIPNPGYPTYMSVSNLVQAEVLSYPLREDNWQPDIKYLKSIDLSEVKLLWINYPNMPTGADADIEVLKELILLCKQNNILLINDNPYSLILNKNKPVSIFQIPGAKDVAIELNSLSKSHNMAGWRGGILVGDSSYISTILKVKSNMDSGMYKGTQLSATEALKLPLSWHDSQNDIYRERRLLAWKLFDLLGVKYQSDIVGMFVWGKLPNEIENAEKFVDEILYEANVFITPGFIFGSQGERYLRISLCADIEKLEESYNRIENWYGTK